MADKEGEKQQILTFLDQEIKITDDESRLLWLAFKDVESEIKEYHIKEKELLSLENLLKDVKRRIEFLKTVLIRFFGQAQGNKTTEIVADFIQVWNKYALFQKLIQKYFGRAESEGQAHVRDKQFYQVIGHQHSLLQQDMAMISQALFGEAIITNIPDVKTLTTKLIARHMRK